MILKRSTYHIPYSRRCQMIVQLVNFTQEYMELRFHHRVHENVTHRSPTACIWYISLTPISILSSHIYTGFLNGLFLYRFRIKNFISFCLQTRFYAFTILHSYLATVWWRQWNYELCYFIHLSIPLFLLRLPFSSPYCAKPLVQETRFQTQVGQTVHYIPETLFSYRSKISRG